MRALARWGAIAAAAALAACAAGGPANLPLETRASNAVPSPPAGGLNSEKILLTLAFSGGGTRAAALSYGVLEELAATTVTIDGVESPLIDQIDVVSSVSGGSFTAAYFGLHGKRAFDDFREVFLTKNVERALVARLFWPQNWFKLARSGYSRADLSADYYDKTIFHGAKLGDFRPAGPQVMINSTAIQTGEPFRFTPDSFDLICSDPDSYPVSLAATASSAVPGAFAPVVLRSYAGGCDHAQVKAWIEKTLAAEQGTTLAGDLARATATLIDPEKRPFVHLVDGGVSDNLGLRALMERSYRYPSPEEQVRHFHRQGVERGLVVVVNATPIRKETFDEEMKAPSSVSVLGAANRAMMLRFNHDTIALARATLARITAEISTPARPVRVEVAEVAFRNLADPARRAHLASLPTSFSLSAEDVDGLRAAGRELLRQDPQYRAFLRDLASRF